MPKRKDGTYGMCGECVTDSVIVMTAQSILRERIREQRRSFGPFAFIRDVADLGDRAVIACLSSGRSVERGRGALRSSGKRCAGAVLKLIDLFM